MSARPRSRPWLEAALSLAVLLFLLVYTAAYFQAPYAGFDFDSAGRITSIRVPQPAVSPLQVGDQIVQIGPVTWADYKERELPFFAGGLPGQTVMLHVVRSGQTLVVPWTLPVPGLEELVDRLLNIWLSAYIFWLAGTLTLLLLRPHDARWRLLVAFNFLTAIWIMSGSLSASRLLASGLVLRAGIWLSLPVTLHLHWEFPRPLGRLPAALVIAAYVGGLGLAALQVGEWLPANAYFYGFIAAALGSLVLIAAHAALRSADRADLRLVLLATGVAMVPAVGLGLAGLAAGVSPTIAGALLGLPALPFAYLYVVARRQLGGLELRVNRAISFYLFLIVLLPAAGLLLALTTTWLRIPTAAAGLVVTGLGIAAAVFGFGSFQAWVERRVLRIPPRPDRLLAEYVEPLAASLDQATLVDLIWHRVLPALLVEQSALLVVDGGEPLSVLYANRVASGDLPGPGDLAPLMAVAGRYRPPGGDGAPCPWARLVLPLRVEGQLAGLWLLGRRAPDDYYALGEVQSLQSLAHQTAIALSHVAQTERLRRLYQANINQREAERTRLARELHDDVLSGLAALMPELDELRLSRALAGLQAIAGRIRQTVSDLRPAVLDHGLWHALAHLVDEQSEAAPGGPDVRLEVAPSPARYDRPAEQHLYRMVQQACDNARAHARARTVRVGGVLAEAGVDLTVEDDGVGFALDPGSSLERHLSGLVQAGHYGLAGMLERANLIGAELRVDSSPGRGTRVQIRWQPPTEPPTPAT